MNFLGITNADVFGDIEIPDEWNEFNHFLQSEQSKSRV